MRNIIIKIVSTLLIGALVIAECLWLYDYFWAPLDIEIDPEPEVSVNCNNYSDYSNRIDYRNGRFGFLSEAYVLTITDGENEDLVFRFVDSFALSSNHVLIENNGMLFVRSFSPAKKTYIDNSVDYFATDDTAAYYLSEECVYRYRYEDGSKELMAENIESLVLKDGYMLCIRSLNTDSSELLKIATDTTSVETVCVFDYDIHFYHRTQVCGEYLVIIDWCNPTYVNLNSGEVNSLVLDDIITYGEITWRCSEEFAYFSYLKRKNNKPIYTKQPSPFNGLWRIDHQTFEKEKISDIPFSYLFVVSDEEIYGIYDEGLYKINAVTKTVKKVSNEGISAYLPKVYT